MSKNVSILKQVNSRRGSGLAMEIVVIAALVLLVLLVLSILFIGGIGKFSSGVQQCTGRCVDDRSACGGSAAPVTMNCNAAHAGDEYCCVETT